mgnify:CR=1 FL=1
MTQAGSLAGVKEVVSTRPKDLRIMEALDAPLAAKKIHIHKSVLQTPFLTHMKEWKPHRAGNRDDALDALAGAIAQTPIRLGVGGAIHGRHTWMQGAETQKANTEFEI